MKYELPHHELIARGVIIQDGALLMNRNTNAKTGESYCALPGGHVDEGESCVQALQREVEEEMGATVSVGDLYFVAESVYAGRHDWDGKRQEVTLFFHAKLTSGLRIENGKILSPESDKNFAWLPLGELQATNLLPLSFKNWLLASLNSAPTSLYDFHDSTLA